MAMLHRGLLSLIVASIVTSAGFITVTAQPLATSAPATLPASAGASDESKDSMLLASEPFISEATGVSFRPPAGCKNQGNDPQYVASYSDDSRKWLLRVTEATFPNPVQLLTVKDKNQQPVQGLLAYTVAQFKAAEPGGEILRGDAGDDVVNVGSYSVGLIAMRYVQAGQTWLRQQAMLQVNDQLYYVFSLVTPGGDGDDQEKTAVETFSALIDTIKVLDRTQIKADQNQRLYRTRALFLYWTKDKFNSILIPKQYFRILKNGKDVGYTFTEELSDRPDLVEITNPGVVAFERTAQVESNNAGIVQQTGAEIFQYISYDRKFEQWTRTVLLHLTTSKGLEETYATEFGNSIQERRRAFGKDIGVPDPKDPHAPATREYEVHHLDVTVSGKEQNTQPVHKDLPPFYLPQAGWHFLPRLVVDKALSNDSPRTYLFAVYVNDKRELMMLYVDVSTEQDVVFAGHQVHAVTVTERLGLEGSPIVHYVTPDGKYLGSEDRKAHLVTVASSDHEVTTIWPTADFTLPDKLKFKNAGAVSPQPPK
jgi:hypothetical protein